MCSTSRAARAPTTSPRVARPAAAPEPPARGARQRPCTKLHLIVQEHQVLHGSHGRRAWRPEELRASVELAVHAGRPG
eukprot:3378011-Alexandrium_andersonii.AAC.1